MHKDKDTRYGMIHDAFETGRISVFEDIFLKYPFRKTTLRKDIGVTNERITLLIRKPHEMTLEEAYKISKMFEVSLEVILKLVYKEYFKKIQAEESLDIENLKLKTLHH